MCGLSRFSKRQERGEVDRESDNGAAERARIDLNLGGLDGWWGSTFAFIRPPWDEMRSAENGRLRRRIV